MPSGFEVNASTILFVLAIDCAILTLIALILGIRGLIRAMRGPGVTGEEGLRRELAQMGKRLAALEKNTAQVAEALPRTVQGVGVVRFNAFPDIGGNMSFSLALLDGRANGVILSVIHDREGARVYGKAVEGGTSSYQLSTEELQALELARGNRR